MNVLIVSPAFPPFSGVGGMRMGSLSKFLRDKGVNVRVLRNNPVLWGKQNLKAEVPSDIRITDVNANKNFFGNGILYFEEVRKVLENESVDLIIYSVGPFYTLLTSYLISKKYPQKHIIDFRDLWSYEKRGSRGFNKNIKFSIMKSLYRVIEKPAVNNSDGIVVVTPGDFDIMSRKYKNKKEKIQVILNGYEEIDFDENDKSNVDNAIQLVSLGKLGYYAPHLAKELFSALEEIKIDGLDIELIHVGPKEESIESILSSVNDFRYECTGYVDYKKGLKIAYESDIAIIVYNHPTGYGTKIFDYIACNKPIILVTEEANDLKEFVLKLKNGFACKNKSQIKDSINYIYKNNIKTLDDKIIRNKYSRNNQNKLYYNYIIKMHNKV